MSLEIESLEAAVKSSEETISSKKEVRKKWNEKRVQIIKILKSSEIYFPTDRRIAEQDEKDIAGTDHQCSPAHEQPQRCRRAGRTQCGHGGV